MAKAKIYFFVPYDGMGQHGTNIREVKMTKKEYQEICKKPWYERGGAYFENYLAAMYYVND